MAKPFTIKVTVEEIAFGPALRKIHQIPGVIGVDVDLGLGGTGPGAQQLTDAAAANGKNLEQRAIEFMAEAGRPVSLKELHAHLGGAKQRASGTLFALKKKGITVSAGTGLHALAHAPGMNGKQTDAKKIARDKAGRAAPGTGAILLRQLLTDNTSMSARELRAAMAEHGASAKAVSGMLGRGKRDGLIKVKDGRYELTAKGMKFEGAKADASATTETTHG